jgi:hypothetical protein
MEEKSVNPFVTVAHPGLRLNTFPLSCAESSMLGLFYSAYACARAEVLLVCLQGVYEFASEVGFIKGGEIPSVLTCTGENARFTQTITRYLQNYLQNVGMHD